MPIYEYQCRDCKKMCEVFQKISDEPLEKCTECGGKLNKVISSTSFVLKGSGWYADGYSSPAPAQKPANAPEKKATVPSTK